MGKKFTQIPSDTWNKMQFNAGILVDSFNPTIGAYGRILCATNGGLSFNDDITYRDMADGIDNVQLNMKELKQIQSRTISLGGTGKTIDPAFAVILIGAADVDSLNENHIVPRNELEAGDFHDLWWIGDYSSKNGPNKGGFVAIHIIDALNTGGFQMKSGKDAEADFAFTFTAHSSLSNPDLVPYDLFVQAGEAETSDYRMDVLSVAGSALGDTAVTVSKTLSSGESYVYQTGSGLYLPSKGSKLVGSAWTAWDGEDEITSTTGLDIIVAIIDTESKAVSAGMTIVTVKE